MTCKECRHFRHCRTYGKLLCEIDCNSGNHNDCCYVEQICRWFVEDTNGLAKQKMKGESK